MKYPSYRFRILSAAIVRLLLAAAGTVVLQAVACEPAERDCLEVGKWDVALGIGLGVRTNPLADGDTIPLLLVPQISYTGERFFIQNLDFGALLWQNQTQQLNLLFTPSYDQVLFERWDPANFFIESSFATAGKNNPNDKDPGQTEAWVDEERELLDGDSTRRLRDLRERHMAGLAGLEYSLALGALDLQVQYLSDFTQVHQGEELRLALARRWQQGKHLWVASLGTHWQSAEVVDYYYGVTPAEADSRGTYEGKAALSTQLRVDWTYQLTRRWDLRLLASYRALPNDIAASPLLEDNKIITLFMGGVYHF